MRVRGTDSKNSTARVVSGYSTSHSATVKASSRRNATTRLRSTVQAFLEPVLLWGDDEFTGHREKSSPRFTTNEELTAESKADRDPQDLPDVTISSSVSGELASEWQDDMHRAVVEVQTRIRRHGPDGALHSSGARSQTADTIANFDNLLW